MDTGEISQFLQHIDKCILDPEEILSKATSVKISREKIAKIEWEYWKSTLDPLYIISFGCTDNEVT